MPNISTETKGPKGVQIKESLIPAATSGFTRGLAVTYGADCNHAAVATAAATACIGLIEEDAVSTTEAVAIIEFGQSVAVIGASVTAGESLTCNAAGQLVPATSGQPVVAIALEPSSTDGDYIAVFVVGITGQGFSSGNSAVNHVTAAGAIPVVSGTVGLGSGAALAMTLATPTLAQDGTTITVVAETAHAHTIKTAANIIQGNGDTVTFAAIGDIVQLRAVGQKWMIMSIGGPTPAALTEV